MKQWSVVGKPFGIYEDGVLVKTDVRLQADDGTYLPQVLAGNHTEKENQELIKLVLDTFAKENVVNFAILESVKDIEQLKVDKEAVTKKLTEVDKAIEASKTQSATSQKALMDVVFLFYSKGLLTDEDIASFTLA
ncbi:phage protein [Streptococcus pseudoporcinus]|uniref:Phage protein n=1 Tax=Streptococcus pseudoporcinus TaxID=361101 RepID=A0A4U9Z0X6_9STRE|nr:DUF1366 domain-containing protein [Streptococcus pseudoporcinus]QBX18735.1 hypothetical protein Javan443_0061 [Streptococcus phage Javan443]QBX18746.1 hypothetical protein Javan445_0006 [Streptococcus phage Javan445]VTS13519.1 phage protein [Streptococcus pseudoporcinus]VTS20200.1 phage protein [Streptococcus pseudoporcinus]VTS32111.1 phage protein [Streptococcus pseudoporcinus]